MTDGAVNFSIAPASPEVLEPSQCEWVSGWLGIGKGNHHLQNAEIIEKLHAARLPMSQRALEACLFGEQFSRVSVT